MKPRFPSRLRLIPAVIVLGAGLVVLKTSGLVHEAQAEEAKPAAHAPQAQVDLAGPEEMNASPSEIDILSSLSKRRGELDSRTRDLDMRANLLAATEKRVDDKIAQLKDLQAQMTKLLNARDTEQEKQLASLVKTYSTMKAKAAADIFASLDDEVLVPVAQGMKSDVLAPVLAAMPPAAAQRLTVKLANRLILPKAPPAPPTSLTPEASVSAPETQPEAAMPQAAPAQKQSALTPSQNDPAAKPVQLAAKEPATKTIAPVKAEQVAAKAPAPKAEAKPATPAKTEQVAAKTPAVKTDATPVTPAKADAKPEAKAEAAPPPAPQPAAPTAPAATTTH